MIAEALKPAVGEPTRHGLKPFLKWPGGKRWLVPHLKSVLNDVSYRRYLEPFLGGGAVFFGLLPANALLSDKNPELMSVYHQVRDNAALLIERIKKLPVDAETFLRMRKSNPPHPLEQAVRFLYLNRTAFGGMYRLNRQGEFNVPYGGGQRTPAPLWADDLLLKTGVALSNAGLRTSDFQVTLDDAGMGDLVYCDPTYTVAHNNNGFIRYNEQNFSWADQERLASASREAARRGAVVVVSNACYDELKALYPQAHVMEIRRWSGLPPRSSKRHYTTELLFVLRPGRVEPSGKL